MAPRLKSIWADDLRKGDQVSFETLGGNPIIGVVLEVDVTDPCMVTIVQEKTWERKTFLRVSNAEKSGIEREDRMMVKPNPLPPVKFTKEEILDKFQGGENGKGSSEKKARKARKKGTSGSSGPK